MREEGGGRKRDEEGGGRKRDEDTTTHCIVLVPAPAPSALPSAAMKARQVAADG